MELKESNLALVWILAVLIELLRIPPANAVSFVAEAIDKPNGRLSPSQIGFQQNVVIERKDIHFGSSLITARIGEKSQIIRGRWLPSEHSACNITDVVNRVRRQFSKCCSAPINSMVLQQIVSKCLDEWPQSRILAVTGDIVGHLISEIR